MRYRNEMLPSSEGLAHTGQESGMWQRVLAHRLAQNGSAFERTPTAMVIHDHELAGCTFAHESLRLGMKYHRRLIGVGDRLERDRSFVGIRTKNDLEYPRSAAPHGHTS